MTIGVQFSPCRKYRYTLDRTWSMEVKRRCMFLMLNPSTADETVNDRTVSRCIDFAKVWGFDGLYVGNLYALRSPYPKDLWKVADPVGADTDAWLVKMAAASELVICGWGGNALAPRAMAVRQMLAARGADVRAFKINADGTPKHPLYVKGDVMPARWAP